MQGVTNIKEIEIAVEQYGEVVVSKDKQNKVIIMSMEEYKKKKLNDKIDEHLLKSEEDIRMDDIYNYIFKELKASESAKNLIHQVRESVLTLERSPNLYPKIEKRDRAEREYRRMVVKSYVLLYTIDECNKIVYVSHMYYNKKNYM